MGSNIKTIEAFIDKILDKPRWAEKEMNLYELLKKKVAQYQDRVHTYDLVEDKWEIVRNIQEQEWYIKSKYQSILNGFLNEMEIDNYSYVGQDGMIRCQLDVKFPRSKFWLRLYFGLEWDPNNRERGQLLQYYFFIEDFDQVKRSYIAYNDSLDTHNLNTDLKLPQMGDMLNIIKTGSYVSKIELIKLFTEIALYFDESECISRTPIGEKYPMPVTYFLRKSISEKN